MMRYHALIAIGVLMFVACSHSKPAPTTVPIPKEASTLSWNRDNEFGIEKYTVYADWTEACTNLKPMGTVAQSPVGVKPELTVYLNGKVGCFAATTSDAYSETALSVPFKFDRR